MKEKRKRRALRRAGLEEEIPWTPLQVARIDPFEFATAMGGGIAECYKNGRYTVYVRRGIDNGVEGWPPITWISIRRNDREATFDYRDLMKIKDHVMGPESEAIQLFPSRHREIDMANQFHLWAFPPGQHVPVGWDEGRHIGTDKQAKKIGARQRDPERRD